MADHGVLLVSRRGDAELRRLYSWLSCIGIPAYRLDSDDLDGVVLSADPDDGTVTVGPHRFAPTVTWVRHFAMRGYPGHGAPETRRGELMLHRDSWRALVRQLGVTSGAVIGAHDPGRLEQHAQATALGIRTPRTVITTEPASVRATFARARYVVKALDRHYVEPEPGRLVWFHTVVLDAEKLAEDRTFAGAPVLVQEYVPHERELRVYLVGSEIHAFVVAKELPHDLWLRPHTVRVGRVDVPGPVVHAVRSLARAWHLPYGVFDFLIDNGEPVFLEVSSHGDWRWFERAAGVNTISVAAARLVRDLHRTFAPSTRTDIFTLLGVRRH